MKTLLVTVLACLSLVAAPRADVGTCALPLATTADSITFIPTCKNNITKKIPATDLFSSVAAAAKVAVTLNSGLMDSAHAWGTSYLYAADLWPTWFDYFIAQHMWSNDNQGYPTGVEIADSVVSLAVVYRRIVNTGTYFLDPSTNDIQRYDSLFDFKNNLRGLLAWLGVPQVERKMNNASSVTYSGSWSGDTVFKYSTTSGAYVEFVTPTATTTVIIGTYIDTTGGSYNVLVDGVSAGTITNKMQAANSHGRTTAPAAFVLKNLTNAVHTIRLTLASNRKCFFTWFYGGGLPTRVGPRVFSMMYSNLGVDREEGVLRARCQSFRFAADSAINELRLAGLNITLVYVPLDSGSGIDFRPDGVHPNTVGANKISDSIFAKWSPTNVQYGFNLLADLHHTGTGEYVHGKDAHLTVPSLLRPTINTFLKFETDAGYISQHSDSTSLCVSGGFTCNGTGAQTIWFGVGAAGVGASKLDYIGQGSTAVVGVNNFSNLPVVRFYQDRTTEFFGHILSPYLAVPLLDGAHFKNDFIADGYQLYRTKSDTDQVAYGVGTSTLHASLFMFGNSHPNPALAGSWIQFMGNQANEYGSIRNKDNLPIADYYSLERNTRFYGRVVGDSSFMSGDPTSGSRAPWRLGSLVSSTTCTAETTKYIQIDISGTAIKVATCQ